MGALQMNEIIKLIQSMPPGVLVAILDLLRTVKGSDDPVRTAQRAAAAIASSKASEAILRKALP